MILFVAADAGPAKYLGYIIRNFIHKTYICVASKVSSSVFDDFGIKYILNDDSIKLNDIDLIVTGTCLGEGVDKKWIEVGRQNKIPTISIIEHWSLYKKRFKLDNQYIFPDIIFVNDDISKQEAIDDGIDKKLLKIVGNPVFENIKPKEFSDKDKDLWKEEMGIDKNKKVITFVSEEYKLDFPKESAEYPGFDEYEVLEDIVSTLNNKMILIIKLHPAENIDKYNYLTKHNNIVILQKTDIDKLMLFSDIIVGMGSMLLLEASMIRGGVYSYRPNETISFIGNKNGMTTLVKKKEELRGIIDNNIIVNTKSISQNNFTGSTKRIVELIKEYSR